MSEKKKKNVIGIKLIQICSLCRKYGSNRYVMQPFCTRQKLIKSNVEKMFTQCICEVNMLNSVSAISVQVPIFSKCKNNMANVDTSVSRPIFALFVNI